MKRLQWDHHAAAWRRTLFCSSISKSWYLFLGLHPFARFRRALCESPICRLQLTGKRTVQLESLGVTILSYIPHDTLLISAPRTMIRSISALDGVVWAAPLPAEAKLASGYWSACRDAAEAVMLWIYVEVAPNSESYAVRHWPVELRLASFSQVSFAHSHHERDFPLRKHAVFRLPFSRTVTRPACPENTDGLVTIDRSRPA